MTDIPRVVFFPDSFEEVNGVAMTSKRLIAYAKKRDHPFLCIHAGQKTEEYTDGSITYLSLKRSFCAFKMDENLAYDPLFQRHSKKIAAVIDKFQPDLYHITGLNDVSIAGAYLAWKRKMPLLGSWHTNLHEFAARRLSKIFRFLPASARRDLTSFAEKKILDGAVLYYRMPKVVLSPNKELVELLGKGTNRASYLMTRGVDTDKFSPSKRTVNDDIFRIGFVGRLRAEKNVRLLIDLEQKLLEEGRSGFKFLIVGEGNERPHLEKHLQNAEFTGFLEGEALGEAYANMDVFVFPSETDAFGNVAQEAEASGVPPIVTDKGGPKFNLEENVSGFVAKDLDDFVRFTTLLMDDPEKRKAMGEAGAKRAQANSWDKVFDGVYDAYRECIVLEEKRKHELAKTAKAKGKVSTKQRENE